VEEPALLLAMHRIPSAAEVRAELAGNVCRCGTHNRIVRAVLKVTQSGGRL
jgi:nicotinate dehydrogenase subunit A